MEATQRSARLDEHWDPELAGEFAEVEPTDTGIRAGAGADMGKLVLRCVRDGRSGLEALTGIPGSVGGCVRMNAGGAFGVVLFDGLEAFKTDRQTGNHSRKCHGQRRT